jgi:hypothetical protein
MGFLKFTGKFLKNKQNKCYVIASVHQALVHGIQKIVMIMVDIFVTTSRYTGWLSKERRRTEEAAAHSFLHNTVQ